MISPDIFNVCKLYLFADNTAITANSKTPRIIVSRLQRYVTILEKWLADWRICLNPDKTTAIYFSKTKIKLPESRINVLGAKIPWSNSVKYLGIKFNKRLIWDVNTAQLINKANRQLTAIYPLINRKSKLNPRTKTNLYKIMIRPILTYGAATWCNASKQNLIKIQIFQNKILKIIANTPRYTLTRVLHRDLNMATIKEFLHKIITSYYQRTDAATNPLITSSYTFSQPNATYPLHPRIG